MLVNVPSFSVWAAQGKKKTSVPMSSGLTSPRANSGPSRQELRRLGHREVAHHQPVEPGASPGAVQGAVHRADGRVLPHLEVPLDHAVRHRPHRRHVRVVAREAGEGVEHPAVLPRRGVAEPRLEEGDRVLRELAPPPRLRVVELQVLLEAGVRLRLRHREVAGEEVVEGRDVRRPLDRSVAAQGEDAAPRPADVAEQELEDRGGADVLHAGRVLGPPHGVAEGGRALPPRRRRRSSPRHSSRNRWRGTPHTSSTTSGV